MNAAGKKNRHFSNLQQKYNNFQLMMAKMYKHTLKFNRHDFYGNQIPERN